MELFIIIWILSGVVGSVIGMKAVNDSYPGVEPSAASITASLFLIILGPINLLAALAHAAIEESAKGKDQ